MINVKRLVENAIIPTKAHENDAGYDLYSIENVTIEAQERKVVKTGISIELPNQGIRDEELYARIAPRSGMAVKNGVTVFAGVIDREYTGEIMVCLYNSDKTIPFEIKEGDRIAQLVPTVIYKSGMREVENITETDRADGGMGSTGV